MLNARIRKRWRTSRNVPIGLIGPKAPLTCGHSPVFGYGIPTPVSECLEGDVGLGRTHCRYTGPYYLAMIIPVLVIASISVSASFYAWIVLGVVIIVGSGIIWWATERAWGKFS